jgi:DNA-binding XRE family transcriptional regulator
MIREAAGLSNAELARAIDVDPSTCFRWESGERIPTGPYAIRYAVFLGELRDVYAARRKVPA